MKNVCVLISILSLVTLSSYSQNLIIKGRIKCENPATNSTRGATNVIVVPGFNPVKSVFTESNERAGFFQLNTGADYKDLIDKNVAIYVASRCENCTGIDMNQFAQYKKVFIDQRIENSPDSATYYMIMKKDWKISKKCEDMELLREQQDSWLRKIQSQPAENIKNYKGSLLLGSPALTALLTNLVTVAPFLNGGNFNADLLGQSKISYGAYLLNSAIALSPNLGFNFSPSRDRSESVFWNPSSIAFARQKSNVSLTTNIKNNLKLAAYTKLNKRLSIGAGVIYTRQDEFRPVKFRNIPISNTDSVRMKLNEFSFYVTPSVKLSSRMALGVSFKSNHQTFTIPTQLQISGSVDNPINNYLDSLIRKQNFDVDVSATYQLTNYLQLGVGAMNLLGSELYAEAFVPGQKNLSYQNQRSLGIGLCYKVWRFNVGSDVLFTQDEFYDASFGINVVPFNNALLSGGYTLNQQSYSVSLRIKHFRVAYLNDNNLLINELRKPVSPIFNGRIYGGFSVNF